MPIRSGTVDFWHDAGDLSSESTSSYVACRSPCSIRNTVSKNIAVTGGDASYGCLIRTVVAHGHESVASAVVAEVAEQEGTDPVEISPSLYEILDPGALNGPFAPTKMEHTRSNGRVEFTYCGHEVTAFSDGRVRARELTDSVNSDSPNRNIKSDE